MVSETVINNHLLRTPNSCNLSNCLWILPINMPSKKKGEISWYTCLIFWSLNSWNHSYLIPSKRNSFKSFSIFCMSSIPTKHIVLLLDKQTYSSFNVLFKQINCSTFHNYSLNIWHKITPCSYFLLLKYNLSYSSLFLYSSYVS